MIVVKISDTGIDIKGHAEYAEIGKDIVCSAVSTLAQTLYYSLEDLTITETKAKIESGYINIHYESLSEYGKVLVSSFFIGVSAVANTYPDYIELMDNRTDLKRRKKKYEKNEYV